jgi:hypothetical protein
MSIRTRRKLMSLVEKLDVMDKLDRARVLLRFDTILV